MRKKKVESKINVGKSKVLRCSRYGNGSGKHVILSGERIEEDDYSEYLWSKVAADEGWKRDVVHRMNEGGV